MKNDNTTVAIPFDFKLGSSTPGGQVFCRGDIMGTLRRRGYISNASESSVDVVQTSFFEDESAFRIYHANDFPAVNGYRLNELMLNYLRTSKVLCVNDDLFLTFTIPVGIYTEYREYFLNCQVHSMFKISSAPDPDSHDDGIRIDDVVEFSVF